MIILGMGRVRVRRSALAPRSRLWPVLASLPLLLSAATGDGPNGAPIAPAPTPALGPLRVLFLRVDFPDHASVRPFSDLQNPARSGLVDRLADYYDEVSSRRFHIEASVSKRVYTLPRRRAEYAGATDLMVRDALALASATDSSGERDWIASVRPEGVVVLFAGRGAESEPAGDATRSPWSASTRGSFDAAGTHVERAVVVAEDPRQPFSPLGVLAHEFGHLLGLPELYAPGHDHEGIGVWGLMGQGTWLGRGDSPPHPCAWSKLRLGWVDAITVEANRRVELPAVERSAQVVKILAKGAESPHEYFLVENRRRIGADRKIPGEGLLVWHVDDTRTSFRRSQDEVAHKRVDLLTADGWPSDLDVGSARGGNRGDAGDPWAARDEGPGPDTLPSTSPYDGSRGRFALRNLSPAGETMSFDVVFDSDASESGHH